MVSKSRQLQRFRQLQEDFTVPHEITPIDPQLVKETSLVREFIGGSTLHIKILHIDDNLLQRSILYALHKMYVLPKNVASTEA